MLRRIRLTLYQLADEQIRHRSAAALRSLNSDDGRPHCGDGARPELFSACFMHAILASAAGPPILIAMKIPKIRFSLPAMTDSSKKDQDGTNESVPKEDTGKASPFRFFRKKKPPIQLRMEEQLKSVLKQNPPPARPPGKRAQRPPSLLETRNLMAGKGVRPDDALQENAGTKVPTAAEPARARKTAGSWSRLGTLQRVNLFTKDELDATELALQKWVLEAKGDPSELESRSRAAQTFIRVLQDPSMNMPKLLIDQSDSLCEEIRNAIGKIEGYHDAHGGQRRRTDPGGTR